MFPAIPDGLESQDNSTGGVYRPTGLSCPLCRVRYVHYLEHVHRQTPAIRQSQDPEFPFRSTSSPLVMSLIWGFALQPLQYLVAKRACRWLAIGMRPIICPDQHLVILIRICISRSCASMLSFHRPWQ